MYVAYNIDIDAYTNNGIATLSRKTAALGVSEQRSVIHTILGNTNKCVK